LLEVYRSSSGVREGATTSFFNTLLTMVS